MTNADGIARYGKRFVRYFYDPMPRNDDTSGAPIWCLGKRYESQPQPPLTPSLQDSPSLPASSTLKDSDSISEHDSRIGDTVHVRNEAGAEAPNAEALKDSDDGGWPAPFLDDFESRIWLTYRSNFVPIARAQDPKASAAMSFAVRLRTLAQLEGFTSDTGWGCMIRSGQSLLANALLDIRLGRDWRTGEKAEEERKLLSLFADDPKAPFSVHRFVEHGASACGKHPGEWFGPSATARCIQALTNKHKESGLGVYINADGPDVYEDKVYQIATAKTGSFTPTLILVGIRLGIDRITPAYREALKASLQMPQSHSGRPSSSHYFVGIQNDTFFYLDPHQTRPALPLHPNPTTYTAEEVSTCHTRRIRRIDIEEMDPSMLLGFLIKDEEDWKRWREDIKSPPGGKTIVHVADKEPVAMGRGMSNERDGAIDEVETFDTEDDDMQ
ncbi:Importin subunit beta-3 [Venturia nashicola]|uniref:Cysteine protease n=1 Tax=Venturia nashicola TaxID=86259 RepID=A0A4Z1NZ03_9PEZI|nr:Importin subunit beta-3 [Venturia nashicola]